MTRRHATRQARDRGQAGKRPHPPRQRGSHPNKSAAIVATACPIKACEAERRVDFQATTECLAMSARADRPERTTSRRRPRVDTRSWLDYAPFKQSFGRPHFGRGVVGPRQYMRMSPKPATQIRLGLSEERQRAADELPGSVAASRLRGDPAIRASRISSSDRPHLLLRDHAQDARRAQGDRARSAVSTGVPVLLYAYPRRTCQREKQERAPRSIAGRAGHRYAL